VTTFRRFAATGLLILALGSALMPTTTTAAGTGSPREIHNSACNAALAFCWSTVYEGARVDLIMESDDRGGRYNVCVEAPDGTEACRPIQLHKRPNGPHGFAGFRNRVVFSNSFKFLGAGRYRVAWKGGAINAPISPVLTFDLGPTGKHQ
jgi:hypothetical protein